MTSRRWVWAALAGAALLAVGSAMLWQLFTPDHESAQLLPRSDYEQPAAEAAAPATSRATAVAAAAAPADDMPPGVKPEVWAKLRAEMARRPDGAQELRRLAAYYRFADGADRFRDARARAPGDPQTTALARTLDATLDERLRQGEVSAPEARLFKIALLEQLESDPVERQRKLAEWQQQQEASHHAAASSHEQEFLQRQAALVAAWQALPPAQRDPKQLHDQLQALRTASFSSEATPPGGHP